MRFLCTFYFVCVCWALHLPHAYLAACGRDLLPPSLGTRVLFCTMFSSLLAFVNWPQPLACCYCSSLNMQHSSFVLFVLCIVHTLCIYCYRTTLVVAVFFFVLSFLGFPFLGHVVCGVPSVFKQQSVTPLTDLYVLHIPYSFYTAF